MDGIDGDHETIVVDNATALLTGSKPLKVKRPRQFSTLCCISAEQAPSQENQKVEYPMFEHPALCWAVKSWGEIMGLQRGDRLAQISTSSDLNSLMGVMAAISTGAMVLIPPEGVVPGYGYQEWLKTTCATSLRCTEEHLKKLGSEEHRGGLSLIKTVCATGQQPCYANFAAHWCTGRKFLMACTSTAAVPSSVFEVQSATQIEKGKRLPFGSPVRGSTQLVLDERDQRQVKPGEQGTLYIGGQGLASSYLDPNDTAHRLKSMDSDNTIYRTQNSVQAVGAVIELCSARMLKTPSGMNTPGRGAAMSLYSASFNSIARGSTAGLRGGSNYFREHSARSWLSFANYLAPDVPGDIEVTQGHSYGPDCWPRLCFFVQSFVIFFDPLFATFQNVIMNRLLIPMTLRYSPWQLLVAFIAMKWILAFVKFTFALLAKWILIGRYREGQHSIYSLYFLRHWLVEHFTKTTMAGAAGKAGGWNFLIGHNFAKIICLKLMGADVAWSAFITAKLSGFDLIRIGPMATVHGPHTLTAVNFVHKTMTLGRHDIGAGATVSHMAVIAAGARLSSNSFVEPLTSIRAGEVVSGCWSGVPGRPVDGGELYNLDRGGVSDSSGSDSSSDSDSDDNAKKGEGKLPCFTMRTKLVFCGFTFMFGQELLSQVMGILPMWIAFSCLPQILAFFQLPDSVPKDAPIDDIPSKEMDYMWLSFCLTPVYAIFNTVLALFMVIVVCRVLPRVRAPFDQPLYSIWSQIAALKISMVTQASDNLGDASIQAWFLRLCGAKVGKGSSMSEQTMLPDTLEIGDNCFFSSGNTLTSMIVANGRMLIPCKTVIDNEVFLGNENHIVEGLSSQSFGGIRTWVRQKPDSGGNFFGNPAMVFGRGSGDGTEETPPTRFQVFWYHFSTSVVDLFFWSMLAALIGGASFYASRAAIPNYTKGNYQWQIPLDILIYASFSVGGYFLVAILFCNTFYNARMPLENPFYSCVIMGWFNNNKIRKIFKKPFNTAMTPWDAPFLRMLGIHVGKRFFTASDDPMIDPPWGRIGDDVTMDYDSQVRQHSFEDFLLKWGPNFIGEGTSLQQAAVVAMSDTAHNVTLRPGSVTWKGTTLEPGQTYEGAPAMQVDEN